MNAVLNFPAPAAVETPVDALGKLQAQIAALQETEKALKEDLKLQAIGLGLKAGKGGGVRVEGVLFDASVSESDPTQSLDPKLVEAKLREVLGADNAFFTDPANVKVRAGSITLKVVAKKVG